MAAVTVRVSPTGALGGPHASPAGHPQKNCHERELRGHVAGESPPERPYLRGSLRGVVFLCLLRCLQVLTLPGQCLDLLSSGKGTGTPFGLTRCAVSTRGHRAADEWCGPSCQQHAHGHQVSVPLGGSAVGLAPQHRPGQARTEEALTMRCGQVLGGFKQATRTEEVRSLRL